MSLLFVSMFTKLSEKWGREKLFYAAIGTFISFFIMFTIVLYPDAFGFASGGLLSTVVEMAAKRVERRHRGIYELDVFVVLCV